MININFRAPTPIWEQVRDNYRALILSGALPEGYKMPSVRELASTLAINPNTIQHAYEALEREGYVYTVTGRGTFAALRSDVGEERRGKLLAAFDEAAKELIYLGLTPEELKARLDTLAKEETT